ncbi:hypothetical protein M3204_03610 [Mesobacillus subterraneus]|uniref:hypothetical protein n=1 Tax=Mesobacillus subterraneus TaxID=285983 RepID=UPI00203BCDE6|nr:hypothetical protein [Mesobacillus subterraneus]MCM3663474.1 hypothetical protein [Mesobacillus subterraneus]MCM3683244.1 hypothetical protein [Mesobacillus subterraneus]
MPGLYSQCSNCGTTYTVQAQQVLFCTGSCERQHDLFKNQKEWSANEDRKLQTMSLFRLNTECLSGNKAALEEWEQRWKEKFPKIKKLPDGRSGNQKISTP